MIADVLRHCDEGHGDDCQRKREIERIAGEEERIIAVADREHDLGHLQDLKIFKVVGHNGELAKD